MNHVRSMVLALALAFSSSPVWAQACMGLPMMRDQYVGGGVSHTGLAGGVSYSALSVTYARQTNLWFENEEGDHTQGYLKLGVNKGTYSHSDVDLDGGATGLSALFTADWDTQGALPEAVSLCGTTGATITAFSRGDASYFSLPLAISAGYTLPLGAKMELTPFVAPTLTAYIAKFDEGDYRIEERGRDVYLDMGAALRHGRWSAMAGYRMGDNEFAEHNRLIISAGTAF